MTRIICGVDISSVSFEARIGREGAFASFPNSPTGIAALAAFCQAHQVELVAMEATGGYEQRALALLSEQGLPVAILNPRAVRRFADSMGQMEKTDRLDAGMIAWYAQTRRSQPVCLRFSQPAAVARPGHSPAPAHRSPHRATQSVPPGDRPGRGGLIDELLTVVARQIRELETAIAQLIAQDPLWRQLDQVFRSIKGVADRTVARLMAEMPEIGTLSNKTISKLAGVAPLARDSGKHQGKRAVRGGRASVREILFIVASVVGRYEPDFIAFQQRLSAAGKPRKVIRIALAHKLLVRLNAKARQVRQQHATKQATTAGPLVLTETYC